MLSKPNPPSRRPLAVRRNWRTGSCPPGASAIGNRHGYNYDPEKARALLKEAGVSGLELELRTLSKQERVVAAQAIQSDLAKVGIKAKVIPMDPGVWWNSGQEAKGDMWKDMQIFIMQFGQVNDPFNVFQWFVKDQVGIWNWERWWDPEFEDLFDKGSSESDSAKRTRDLCAYAGNHGRYGRVCMAVAHSHDLRGIAIRSSLTR